MTEITAVIDLGKSLAKTIWTTNSSGKREILFLEPEIVTLTANDIANAKRENADPEKDAWLVLPNGTGEAFGFITRTSVYRNRRKLGQDELKTVNGVNRCLSILGSIAERAGLSEYKDNEEIDLSVALNQITEFSVTLCILLPLSEWSTSQQFKANLLNALQSGFNFRGIQYKVNVDILEVKTEGSGLLRTRQSQLTSPAYRNRVICCLVMGHYNNSLFLYEGGQQILADCSSNGFYQLVDMIVSQTALDSSNVASSDLTQAIYEATSDSTLVQALLWQKVKDRKQLKQQVSQAVEIITRTRSEFWESVIDWIYRTLGPNFLKVNEVLITGGSSRFFQNNIEEFFGDSDIDILWSCQLNKLVGRDFNLPAEDNLSYRLSDVYGVFNHPIIVTSN